MLVLKRCGDQAVRSMFSCDPIMQEKWLKDATSRIKFEGFLRQLHFEDAADPTGSKWEHSLNYRPNGVPKVGLYMEHYRRRCCLFIPEEDMSFDEATAKYGGRMTHLKHLQSKFKPYDGIRVYSLNGSKTGYTQNFRVDLRDCTSIATMFRGVLKPIEGKGYTVWGDNAFTSVAMLKYVKEKKVNFAGTTRTTYGFPADLIVDDLPMGEFKWAMCEPGLLAAFWSDVGFVKLMSNHHTPTSGHVLRKVAGQSDREERGAPTVAVEYNDKMGGVDLKDFMRGLFTTQRRSKKWWKTLWYWCLDSSMYNGFCLYKWCYFQYHNKVCKMRFKRYIRLCLKEVFGTRLTRMLTPTPPKGRHWRSKRTLTMADSSPATAVTANAEPRRKKPYIGPHDEKKPAPPGFGCMGGELTPTELGSARRRKQKKCKYCLHAHGVRKDTTWVCSNCAQPVCLGCIYRYHVWVNHSERES